MMMLQATPPASNMVQIVSLVCGCIVTCFTAWIGYQQIVAKRVSDQHTGQIQEVKALVNGSLGVQTQTLLTSAKALAVAEPTLENAALAVNAQKAMDAHVASQDAINQGMAAGVKTV